MYPFLDQLKSLCAAHPARSKWVFVPTHAIGRTLGERIVMQGSNWLNLRFVTPLDIAQFVRFQKRLLAGVREGAMESPSTGHAAHAKYVGLLSLSADIRVSFIPVHLRFSAPNVGLRN